MTQSIWKKALSLLLSCIMLIATIPLVSAISPDEFSDFPTGWSKEAVTAAVENGLLNGRSADKIEPQGTLTRAEMATIINRAFGAEIEADISGYTDVAPESWYYKEIAKAVNMQTFQGNGDNTMRPDASITREEVFAVIARALVLETEDFSALDKFSDNNNVSDWAKPYAAILVSKNYVNGDDLGKLNPKSDITREEFAQIMHNIIKTYYVTKGTHDSVNPVGSALIRTGNVKLQNVTINGDLILGDGVGKGNVELVNVTIKGRLLARGGEGKVKLTKTTVGEYVVVKDVNGVVNFNNYRGEAPFKGIIELTKATFLTPSGSSSSGGGSSYLTYTVSHYVEDPAGTEIVDGVAYRHLAEHDMKDKASSGSEITIPDALALSGYSLNTTIGYGGRIGQKVTVNLHREIKIYYDINRYTNTIVLPNGTEQPVEYKHGEAFGKNFNTAAYPDTIFYYIPSENAEPVIITADTPITGSFRILSSTAVRIVFHYNDNTETAKEVKLFPGDKLGTNIPDISRNGYTLTSWNSAKDGSGTTYTADSEVSGAIDLYAQWKTVPYTITYVSDVAFKGGVTVPYQYDIETAVTLPGAEALEAKPGFNFGGWYKEPEFINRLTSVAVGTSGNLTLYARWIPEEIVFKTVSFLLNYPDAPTMADVPVEQGKTVAKPEDPVRKGYLFDGWYTDESCTKTYDFSASVTDDISLYAGWIAEEYAISYELNGGSFRTGASYPTTYTMDGTPVQLPTEADVSYEGKTFAGWYKDAELTLPVSQIPAGSTGTFKVYAKWTDNIYTVTVISPGETDQTFHFVHNQVISDVIVKEPTRIGYDFLEYNTAEDGSGTSYKRNDKITQSLVLYARWTVIHYNITYELNGASITNPEAFPATYTVNDSIVLPTASDFEPMDGFTFMGWYSNEAFSGSVVTTIPAGSTGKKTFYAKWEKNTYQISFVVDGKQTTKTYTHGDTIGTQVTDPTKDGFTFLGWSDTEADGGNLYSKDSAVTFAGTLYAKWEKITYHITYHLGDGHAFAEGFVPVSEFQVDTETFALPTAANIKESETHVFFGWFTDEALTQNISSVDKGTAKDIDVYAKWIEKTINYYTVKFLYNYQDAPQGGVYTSLPVRENTSVSKPADPERTGYEFAGWYQDAECSVSYNFATPIAAETLIYAKWNVVSYNITFNTYGATIIHADKFRDNYNVEEEVILPDGNDMEKSGYTFDGWFDNESFTGFEITSIPAGTIGEKTYYAKWSKISYSITYVTNEGTIKNQDAFVENYTVTDTITLPGVSDFNILAGYEFLGWFDNEAMTGTAISSIPAGSVDNKTFYAKWSKITYSISYVINGGTIKNPDAFVENYTVTDTVTLPVASDFEERAGYTFLGWFDNEALTGTAITSISAGSISGKTFYAKWIKNAYTITYVTNGGVIKNQDAFAGNYTVTDTIALPVVSDFEDRAGYTFLGWFDNEALTGEAVTSIPAGSVGNKTFYAKWEKNTYTITYVTNDGVIKNQDAFTGTYTVTDTIALPVASDFEERAGYTFAGWFDNEALTGTAITSIPAGSVGNKTFYAKWIKNTYTITYVTNDGVIKNQDAFVGGYDVTDTITLPVASDFEERAGYTFLGWFDNEALTGEAVTSIPTGSVGNKTFYAKWEKISYTITYATNGGVIKNQNAFVGNYTVTDTITLPVASDFEERAGYTFLGWFDNEALTGEAVTSIPTGSVGNKTFYAKWEKNTYTITYATNGGVIKNQNAFVGNYTVTDTITLPVASDFEERAGYTFAGWFDNEALTGVAISSIPADSVGNKTFYAKWITNAYTITYVINGGSIKNQDAFVGGYDVTDTVTLPVASDFEERAGYTFLGWFDNEALTGEAITSVPEGSAGNKTFYVKWEKISYTITYATNDGVIKNQNAFVGNYTVTDTITLPVASDFEERAGYTFAGWFDNEALTGEAVTSIPADSVGNKAFFAKWEKISYTITYATNDGVIKNQNAFVGNYTVTDTITLPVASDFEERDGFTFAGWFDNEALTGTAITSIPTGSVGNKTFYAKWATKTHDITFHIDGTIVTKTIAHGETIGSQLVNPEKEGFLFLGWNTAEDGSGTPYNQDSVVTEPMTLYAQWQEIVVAEQFTVTFYDGVVEDDYMVINSVKVNSGAKLSDADIQTALNGFEPYSYKGYKDGTYTHLIYPELRYKKADGSWALFDSTVTINSDINVYYAFKNLSLFFDLKFGEYELAQPVSFSVPYETDTRIMDSLKDALTLGRNQVSMALTVDDVYAKAIGKMGEKTGLADANGNIQYLELDAALSSIIDVNEVDGEIANYIEMLIVENTDDAKIDSAFHLIAESNLVKDVILGGESYDYTKVKAYIDMLSVDERIALADQLHDALAQQTFYIEFIDAYRQEHAYFHVTHESVDLIMALASAVNDYTYDELKDRIRNKFGSVINLIGDEAAEDFLRDAQDRYYQGAHDVWEDVHNHDDDASYESTYPSYLTFKVNVVEHLFKPLYTDGRTKLVNRLQGDPIYRYNENPYLQELVSMDTDKIIQDLLYPVPKTDTCIGYAFWPATAGESGFLHYYDYMLEKLILFDKAMLWYEENLTEDELALFKDKIFADTANAVNKMNEMLDAYETDGSLPLGMNINQLKEQEAFNKLFSRIEGPMNRVIAKYKTTPFYGKVWDATSIRTDIAYAEEMVDVLLGQDNPTFNIDSLMDKKNLFDKAGFTDYNYGDDEALGTVTVQAIERTFKENLIKARRYYQ